ncbi:Histone transcription regulator 3 [Taxawa tesnikishii (nom. ined.)]|nr:Histone transcription regulator 3 [Dothideales sp. JES 119]
MATFKALNIESDDESDTEIDDTKELQIEEALKLYQTALKYHAEGPRSYGQAANAYKALFESEIFKYPESQSELRRLELYGSIPEQDYSWPDEKELAAGNVVGVGEGAPSTLPQILHLAYKNHGEFALEFLQWKLRHPEEQEEHVDFQQITRAGKIALGGFVEALDKDDSDVDLWRKTSSVGEVLGSHRIARFCLEAVMDGDDDGLNNVLSLPGLDESLAGQQLRELVVKLQDELSILQQPLSHMKRKQLSKMLRQRLDTYSAIKAFRQQHEVHESGHSGTHQQPLRSILNPPNNWADLGDLLYRQMLTEQHGPGPFVPGSAVSFELQDRAAEMQVDQEPVLALPAPVAPPSPKSSELPQSIEAQFPGVDHEHPTAPVPSFSTKEGSADSVQEIEMHDKTANGDHTIALPTRKRSSDAAALHETADGGRTKSKRLRARESLAEQGVVNESIAPKIAQQLQTELAQFQAVDDWTFDTIGAYLRKFGIPGFNMSSDFRAAVTGGRLENRINDDHLSPSKGLQLAAQDLHSFVTQYSDNLAHMLLLANNDLEMAGDPQQAGFAGILNSGNTALNGHSTKPTLQPDGGLISFMQSVNKRWLHIRDVAYLWVHQLLVPGLGDLKPPLKSTESSYTGHQWPESLKTIVVRILVTLDDFVYEKMSAALDVWSIESLRAGTRSDDFSLNEKSLRYIEMIQSIFELHLDVYSLIKQPNSGVDVETITIQGDRTHRWAHLARDVMNLRASLDSSPTLHDKLNLRYLWATTFHVAVSDDLTREHVIACMQELKVVFQSVGGPAIELQNNAIMPLLSVEAIDREISRLTTQDFFTRIFDQNQQDPAGVIEGLEPLLETLHQDVVPENVASSGLERLPQQDDRSPKPGAPTNESPASDVLIRNIDASQELMTFLNNSKVSLRLSLWQRLRAAYEAIEYWPMVLCCRFRVMELLVAELKSPSYTDKNRMERQMALLRTLRPLQDLLVKVLYMIKNYENALECMDNPRLKSSIQTLADLLRILHASNLMEDEIQIGRRMPPLADNGQHLPSFPAVASVLHDLQLHAWVILYLLFKEALVQNTDIFMRPDEDRVDFLRSVHRSVGLRGLCAKSHRILLNMMKQELFQLRHVEGCDLELCQVLYDIYGLKCFLDPTWEQLDHGCVPDAVLDKSTALQSVDLLMTQASKIKMTDLAKHPLKDTIEKVHGVIVRKKPSEAILRNRDVYRAFLKSPIHPVDLYKCLTGEGELTLSHVPAEQAVLASKGWYFLMGHMALSKFRSQKRTGPTPTEDIEIAIAFFMQDLEYSMGNWETWFRLAQAYDSKIEEIVSWSAEKMNSSSHELVQFQRAAIHCYTLAVALAVRKVDPQLEASVLAELYSDFANRVYASSREPFSMQAFQLEADRYLSTHSIIKVKPFHALRRYTAWKFAKVLFQRAIAGKPDKWFLHYMLGKCLWKMHTYRGDSLQHNIPPSYEQVVAAFIKAIDLLPERKDSKREPILEPHYKLVSIVHKLVVRWQEISPSEASKILTKATPYARKVDPPEDLDSWQPYILAVLKNLRAADRSNWHHRMIARAAHIIYDESPNGHASALGAKHELTQQMFTKTMVLQVWKPELLDKLNDRTGLETLAKRVRKRPSEFYEHAQLWQDLCTHYLKLLRRYAQVTVGHETTIFSGINHEDFLQRKEPLEKWCQDPLSHCPTLDVLNDAIELKRINGGYMKPGAIDDLIGDAYACLYDTIGRDLWAAYKQKQAAEKADEEARAAEKQTLPQESRNPMMSLARVINLDGTIPVPPSHSNTDTPAVPSDTTASGTADQAPPTRRKIGVGRREIRLFAERCVQKAVVSTHHTTPVQLRTTPSNTKVQVVIDSRPRMNDANAPTSLHDSEDDDSELSDVDEDLVNEGPDGGKATTKVMFPNLVGDEDAGDEDGGDEDEDEEMEGNDEEGEEDEHGAENDGEQEDAVMTEGGKEVRLKEENEMEGLEDDQSPRPAPA